MVENGANIYSTDKSGNSVLDLASAPWSPELEGVYRLLYGLLSMDLDVERIKTIRPATAKFLSEQAKKRPKPSSANEELFAAVLNDDAATIKKLIAAGTVVDAKEPNGSTALQLSAVFGKSQAARVLVTSGANIEVKNSDGVTALYNACFFAHPELVEILLECGADTTVKSKQGATAMDVVTAHWSPELEGIYRTIYALIGQPPELKRIKEQRVEVTRLLREHLAKKPVAPVAAELRTWKTADGKKTVQAAFLKANATQVQLKRADGRTVSVPIKILSEADRAYVAEMSKN